MAFVSDPNAQDPTQQQGGQANPLSQQAPITSAPPAGAAKAAVTPSNSAPTQPFTNLQSYLTSNDPYITKEGQTIAGNLTGQYGQIQNDIKTGQDTFGSQVASGYTPMDQATLDAFAANPSSVAANPDQSKSFTGMYGDRYAGPANFETSPIYGDLSGKVSSAVSNAQNLQTPAGIESYFTSQNPNYTQGEAMLDAALLQGNPSVVDTISAAAKPFNDLPGYLTSAVTSADAGVQAANQQAQAAKAAAQAAGGKASTDFATRLNDLYSGTIKKDVDYNNLLNGITAKIGNGDFASLTPQEQSLIGFNPAILPYIQNYPNIFKTQAANNPLNPSLFYTQGSLAPVATPADIVSPDDIATFQALQSLTGGTPMVNFDMPTTSAVGTPEANQALSGQAGALPAYNNVQALNQIIQSYGPMYDQLKANGFQGVSPADQATIMNYMNGLYQVAGSPQPGSQPTTPPPAPGTGGDLGAGFHWDPATGSWQPTIPLAPPHGPPSGGGGHHTF